MEVGDALAKGRFRQSAIDVIDGLRTDATIEIAPASSPLFPRALRLHQARQDKDWGLTDGASFAVMQEQRLHAARTADDHFRQGRFRALLLEP